MHDPADVPLDMLVASRISATIQGYGRNYSMLELTLGLLILGVAIYFISKK